jgi:hypothetical protein
MRDCILCGRQTAGSIGAAGLHWAFICQPCKDAEDRALAARIKVASMISERIFGDDMTVVNAEMIANRRLP